jgi:biotin transport system substrate-specific component
MPPSLEHCRCGSSQRFNLFLNHKFVCTHRGPHQPNTLPNPMLPARRLLQTTILPAIIGAVAITLAAQIAIPLDPVPITLHTVAVLLIAWIAGPTVGSLAALLYLILALCGLPVLTGWARSPFGTFLNANSAGYVVAFIPAAFVFGKLIARTPPTAFLRVLLLSLLGHAIILAIGFIWLASRIGLGDATSGGLVKLLPGAAVKSLLVAATIYAWHHLRNRDKPAANRPATLAAKVFSATS